MSGGKEAAVLRQRKQGQVAASLGPEKAEELPAKKEAAAKEAAAKEGAKEAEAKARTSQRWVDVCMVVVLTLLGLCSRFYLLHHPAEVVFDEQHFGKFVNWYIKGEYYLDIHPPLGKLIMMVAGLFMGYEGQLTFGGPGEPYIDDSFIVLRFLPALFGSFLVPLMYITVRVIGVSPPAAGLAAWMVLCDNAIITESRAILCDSFLFFFDILAVLCSFQANRKQPLSLSWALWLTLCGLAMGMCVSVKLTGLGIVGAVGMHQIMVLFKSYDRPYRTIVLDFFWRGLLLLGPFFVVFVSLFVVHILLLPYYGDGDDFMTGEFLARLTDANGVRQEQYTSFRPLSLFAGIKELISTMHAVNIGLKATHPFQSYWYQWPIIQCKPVLFWQRLRAGYSMYIYCVGNPAIWLSTTAIGVVGFMVVAAAGTAMRFSMAFSSEKSWKALAPRGCRIAYAIIERYWWASFMLWVGFLANYLPFSLIPRAVWNYHYLPSLLFAIMLTAVVVQIVLDILERHDRNGYVAAKALLVALVVTIACFYLYLAPWTYALPLSSEENDARMLFSSWTF